MVDLELLKRSVFPFVMSGFNKWTMRVRASNEEGELSDFFLEDVERCDNCGNGSQWRRVAAQR